MPKRKLTIDEIFGVVGLATKGTDVKEKDRVMKLVHLTESAA